MLPSGGLDFSILDLILSRIELSHDMTWLIFRVKTQRNSRTCRDGKVGKKIDECGAFSRAFFSQRDRALYF